MNVSPSKENILKKIRKALTESTPIPFPQSEGAQPVFLPAPEELEIQFAEEFTRLLGKFVFCINQEELIVQLSAVVAQNKWTKVYSTEPAIKALLSGVSWIDQSTTDLENCEVSITSCECLVARTGSIVLSAAQQNGRTVSVFAPVHICIAFSSQLVYDVKHALEMLKSKYKQNLPSLISFATGPSRTADIEKTLVVGVHGPKEVFVFLVDDPVQVK